MKKVFSIAGAAAGVFSIIMSFVVLGKETGYYVSNSSYGGDAYTGIQNAAAETANNVIYLGDMIQLGLFAVLFAFGLACAAHFGKQVFAEWNEEKAAKTGKAASVVEVPAAEDAPVEEAAETVTES